MKDWRGNEVKTTKARDLKPGDRIAHDWGRETTVKEVTIRGGRAYVRTAFMPDARWEGDIADCWVYRPDREVPERDVLRGYTGVYLGD
jgi:hypothetical protein